MDFSLVVGMLNTAHKVLHTYVVILLPSCNDAYGPPLAVIMYSGQLSKEGPKAPRRARRASQPSAGVRRGAWSALNI